MILDVDDVFHNGSRHAAIRRNDSVDMTSDDTLTTLLYKYMLLLVHEVPEVAFLGHGLEWDACNE